MENDKIIQQLKNSYYNATGKDLSEWEKAGIPFTVIPDIIYLYVLYNHKQAKTIDDFKTIATKYHGVNPSLPEQMEPIAEFLSLFRQKRLINNKGFISAAVGIYLPFYRNEILTKHKSIPQIPQCENNGEVFLDLVSGFSFIQFYPVLRQDSFYYLVDISLFACEGLEQGKKQFPHLNIEVLRKNVLKLEKEDFCAPVSVLRAKNLSGYVPVGRQEIRKFQSFVRPGGQFVFQELSYRKKKYPSEIKNCFKGWEKKEILGDANDRFALDSLIYIKPL